MDRLTPYTDLEAVFFLSKINVNGGVVAIGGIPLMLIFPGCEEELRDSHRTRDGLS
jgi:hypothetical protein